MVLFCPVCDHDGYPRTTRFTDPRVSLIGHATFFLFISSLARLVIILCTIFSFGQNFPGLISDSSPFIMLPGKPVELKAEMGMQVRWGNV